MIVLGPVTITDRMDDILIFLILMKSMIYCIYFYLWWQLELIGMKNKDEINRVHVIHITVQSFAPYCYKLS